MIRLSTQHTHTKLLRRSLASQYEELMPYLPPDANPRRSTVNLIGAQLDLDTMRPHKPLLVEHPLLLRILQLNLQLRSAPLTSRTQRATYLVLREEHSRHLIQLHHR